MVILYSNVDGEKELQKTMKTEKTRHRTSTMVSQTIVREHSRWLGSRGNFQIHIGGKEGRKGILVSVNHDPNTIKENTTKKMPT